MEHYYTRNEDAHNKFYAILDRQIARDGILPENRAAFDTETHQLVKQFSVLAKELHNRQWSEHIYNIISNASQCPNDCRYCYMKTIKSRFFGTPTNIEDAATHAAPISVNQKRVAKKWLRVTPEHAKLIMFPSSHDIVPSLLADYISVARKILEAGHSIMIVSKPRMDCFVPLANVFENFKSRIIYRLTIGSERQDILNFWEPNAPPFTERLEVLRMLHARGCITSVSIEPFLSDPRVLIPILAPYVSETIWIGQMSGLNQELAGGQEEYNRLNALYTIPAQIQLTRDLRSLPGGVGQKIRWKAKLMGKVAEVVSA
jgi:hypothetical protein